MSNLTSIYSRRRKQLPVGRVKNTRRFVSNNSIISVVEGTDVLNLNNITTNSVFTTGNINAGSFSTGGGTITGFTTQTITFDGATGENELIFPDGLAEALVARSDAPADYLVFNSATPSIEIDVPLQLNDGELEFTAGTGANEILIPNTLAEALVIRNTGNTEDYLVIDSVTNALELPEGRIDFEAASGFNEIVVPDSQAEALIIRDLTGGNDYITIDSSDEAVTIDARFITARTTTSSGAAAIPLTGTVHEITTTGVGNALTLANGTDKQHLFIIYVAESAGADTAVLTPTTLAGGNTITFNDLGDAVHLLYSTNGGWYIVGIFNAVVA